jgi:hypothetical protein
MEIARGNVYISEENLKELLHIPNNVEIVGINRSRDGVEFEIVSAGEVKIADLQLTQKVKYGTLVRRVSVETIKKAQVKEVMETINNQPLTIVNDNGLKHWSVNEQTPATYVINVTVDAKLDKNNTGELAKMIMEQVDKHKRNKGIK